VRKPKLNRQRILIIKGILSDDAFALSKDGLPKNLPPNTLIVFTDYSLAEFAIGEQFAKVFLLDDIDVCADIHCEIVGVTQQWSKPFDVVPEGWKTICALRFTNELPEMVKSLPISDHSTWGGSEFRLGLSDDETWQQLLNKNTKKRPQN
jgi:hypothetical protein